MVHNLTTLLNDADPLRREEPFANTKREQVRLRILGHAATIRSTRPEKGRHRFSMAIAVATLVLVVLAYGLWLRTAPVFAAVRFEVRLAENQPSQGLIVERVGDSGRLIYLHPEIVVSNDDITHSWVSQDGDGFSVSIEMASPGADRLRRATSMHVGRPVAVLLDGSVVMAPTVRSPIGNSAVISGNLTRAEADRIAEGVRLN